jgi:dipeptidyl aminopeptidase/acylaminoacyl peptidase
MSERDGWNHLYLVDAVTGVVKHPITRGNWVVRRVQRVDADKRQVWLFTSGIEEGQDPYFEYLCRVNFDGSGWTVLTPGPGTHRVEFSPDGRFLLDTWSRVDQPPVTELREFDTGRLICEVARADASKLLATGWRPPVPFAAPGRDGRTVIHGVLYFPRDFRDDRKYPVIEQIYAGPQDSYVPKSFRSYYDEQALAELGFIVVQIDGMGTSNRSKAFHDVCWKNLGDAGFPDRKLWLRAAAERYPAMDLSRVGIYGGSAGGQNALRGLLMHPDTYHVGVADCGCHDNRMDKVWWNELWMGWPVGPHYAEQSNVTQAHRLQGKLLLTVGELDRNVDPASTMQVVDALIRADRDFDLLVVPGSDHGAGESAYARRRRADFFVRHLLGREPRWEP